MMIYENGGSGNGGYHFRLHFITLDPVFQERRWQDGIELHHH